MRNDLAHHATRAPLLPDLYRARGYEETGEWPLEYREYDEIVMEKRLDG